MRELVDIVVPLVLVRIGLFARSRLGSNLTVELRDVLQQSVDRRDQGGRLIHDLRHLGRQAVAGRRNRADQ